MKQVSLRLIPLLAGLLPIIGAHIAFVLSAQAGHIPDCFPYFDGCTSISSAGRQPPGSFWFKGLMIPAAVCTAVYWTLTIQWLTAMGEQRAWILRSVLVLGLVSSVGLIFYSVVLGHIGDEYRLMRRIGMTLYFGLGYLAQLIVTSRLYYLRTAFPAWIFNTMFTVVALILAWGLLNVFLAAFYERFDDVKDLIEWNVALLKSTFYVLTYFLWRATSFDAVYKVIPRYKV